MTKPRLVSEPRPQPIRPSPMMGELGHGRPSLFRWLRERKQLSKDDDGSDPAYEGAIAKLQANLEDGWRDYDHGFRDGYQSALREHPGFVSVAEIKALLPRVYDGTHLVDCPYVEAFQRIREAISDA